MRPGMVKPDPKEFLHIPILRLRILTPEGKLVQVLFKGETPGDADIGEIVRIRGIDRGGVIHARRIFNETTQAWVTSPPGFFERLLGG